MRKFKKNRILAIIVILSLFGNMTVFADENNTDVNIDNNGGSSTILISDGQSGEETSSIDSEDNTNSSTTTSSGSTLSESARTSINNSNNIQNTLNIWVSQLRANRNNGKFFGGFDYSPCIRNISYTSIPKSDIAGLLNQVITYRSNLVDNWIDSRQTLGGRNAPSQSFLYSSNDFFTRLGTRDLIRAKASMLMTEKNQASDLSNEYIDSQIPNLFLGEGFSVGNNDFTFSKNSNDILKLDWNNDNYFDPNFILSGNLGGTHIREDAFMGVPSLSYFDLYSERFNAFEQMARKEGWPSQLDNRGLRRYYIDPRMSSALSDDVYIALLTEYSIIEGEKDVITNVNYTSDERRWTIYLDGQPVSEPIITDNPLHALDFTTVYNEHGAGEYYVVAEQLATYNKSTFIKYNKAEYMFDMATGSILWWNESKYSNGGGGSIYLGTEYIDTPEWVATGDTFNITVNNHGEVDTDDGSGTERTD